MLSWLRIYYTTFLWFCQWVFVKFFHYFYFQAPPPRSRLYAPLWSHFLLRFCCLSFPLTLILYHTLLDLSIGFYQIIAKYPIILITAHITQTKHKRQIMNPKIYKSFSKNIVFLRFPCSTGRLSECPHRPFLFCDYIISYFDWFVNRFLENNCKISNNTNYWTYSATNPQKPDNNSKDIFYNI